MKSYDKTLTRLILILTKLSNNERPTTKELSEEFGIGIRTIQRDIYQRLVYFPIEKDSEDRLKFIDGFSLDRSTLDNDEMMLVYLSLSQLKGLNNKFEDKINTIISKLLIPFKNIGELLRALDAAGDIVVVSYNKNQVSIQGKGVYFTSRLIDGGFPPYHLIIPKEETTKVVVMKQELLSTLKLSNIFADKFMQVMFTVDPHTKKLIISSKNSDIGSSESVVDAVIQGKDIQVVCNLKYFLDVFQALSGDSVSLSFTEPNKPIVVRSVSDTSFLYLLMPANR